MDWSDIRDSFRNSVVKIRAEVKKFDKRRPYQEQVETVNYGTGFVVDVDKGYIVTTLDTVNNPLDISCSFQHMKGRKFKLSLVSKCRTRNIALCRFPDADLTTAKAWFKNYQFKSIPFGDSYKIKEVTQIISIGYPDDNLSIQPAYISGFKNISNDKFRGKYDDIYRREPTYIIVDTVHKPGMNGSPVIDNHGRTIGMIVKANDDGRCLAILSRSIISISKQLTLSAEVTVPNISFDWQRTDKKLTESKCGDPKVSGIYIRNIYPDSLFDKMKSGDVVIRMEYPDYFWQSEDIMFGVVPDTDKVSTLACFFDRFGNVVLNIRSTDPIDRKFRFSRCLDRILDITEVFDSITYGVDTSLSICRDKKWYTLEAKYEPRVSNRILPCPDHVNKITFSNIECTQLYMCQLLAYPNLKAKALADPNFWYQQSLVITRILPGGPTVLSEGDIITKVNGVTVSKISDINIAMPKYTIENDQGAVFIG